MKLFVILLMIFSFSAQAAEPKSTQKAVQKDARIYQVNKYGQTQYHKESLRVKGDRVYQVNKFGQTQYHKPSFKIKK